MVAGLYRVITRICILMSLYRIINAISLLSSDINSGKSVVDGRLYSAADKGAKNSASVR